MNISVCGALNLESVNDQPYQLLGGAYYAAFSIAQYLHPTQLVGCIGTEIEQPCLEEFFYRADKARVQLALTYESGRNFKHSIYINSGVETKDMGEYKNFFVKGISFTTEFICLVSGSPQLHKSALLCCEKFKQLVFESKLIYYQECINAVLEIFSDCHIYSANAEEMDLMLKKLSLEQPYELFQVNRKLNIIIHHCHGAGGSIYLANGKKIQWHIKNNIVGTYKTDVGAGDIFLGHFLGHSIKNQNVSKAVQVAAAASLYSVMKIGHHKITYPKYLTHYMKNIQIIHDNWRIES